MNDQKENNFEPSVKTFIEKTIWNASLLNRRRSSALSNSHKRKEKSSNLELFERILDLFTHKAYKWQLDRTDYLVPYEESIRRLVIYLFIVTGIVITICTIMMIVVSIILGKELTTQDINNKSN